jgi:hypothetical protein
MKWLILAIVAEVSVLLCLIFAFDGEMHSFATMRLTWDHAAVVVLYTMGRGAFSWKRTARPEPAAQPTQYSRAA